VNAGKEPVKQAPPELKDNAQLVVEYTLTVVLFTLLLWVAIKYIGIDKSLSGHRKVIRKREQTLD
jgi:hypothetical protein